VKLARCRPIPPLPARANPYDRCATLAELEAATFRFGDRGRRGAALEELADRDESDANNLAADVFVQGGREGSFLRM
jgi:hypothetical protein